MFMASSSSLSRPGCVHNVFVSFRGEDTRKNFMDHLYIALHDARIDAFRDDEKLRCGEEISLQISKAIQESKISIVVFSQGYASSTWCLGELQKILECRHTTGQIVLPVFYDIDPSDIRKQTGSFAEAFDRHERRFKEEMEKVQRWRKALVEAANLSGLDRRSIANGHESKLIQKIVEEVSSKLNPSLPGKAPSSPKRPTTSHVDESGVYGRDDDREAILNLLLSDDANEENPGVVPIGGMGGVGKTTLAQLAYNDSRVQVRFDLKAWVCVSDDFSVLKLTKAILEEVDPASGSGSLNNLQTKLKERLQGKKFLLVLDDVWNEDYDEWDRFLTPLKYGAQGSKILVTTRNDSVASVMQTVPTHHLKELTEDICWSLFAKHAFRGENPNDYEELLEIGRRIARKCKGLPLAAKTLGGLLSTKRDVEEWEKILESNLWDLPNEDILPALKLRFHYPRHI